MENITLCPKCKGKLIIRDDGKRYCKTCDAQYQIVTRAVEEEEDDKLSAFLIFLIILVVLALGIVIGLLLYRTYFGGYAYHRYYEKEYTPYYDAQANGSPTLVSTEEASERNLAVGDAVQLSGTVEDVKDNLLNLDYGVSCYFIPEVLSAADRARLPEVLGSLHSGDAVYVNGMVCGTDPLSIKYCGLPHTSGGGLLYEGAGPSNSGLLPAGDVGEGDTPTEPGGILDEPGTGLEESGSTAGESGILSDHLYRVLAREETFFNCGLPGYNYEPPNVLEYETSDLVTGGYETTQYTTRRFAIIDIWQDGVNEVLLWGTSADGESRFTLLHEDAVNGIVIGNIFSAGNNPHFKTNGCFSFERSDGDPEIHSVGFGDYAAQGIFPGDEDYGYGSLRAEAAMVGGGYFLNMGDPVSEEEYEARLREIGWYEAEDAVFYDYTDENIRRFAT